MATRAREIVLGVTGSIAAYKACDIIRGLRAKGFTVSPVLTAEGREFITPLALETLACHEVYGGLFQDRKEWDPIHISLADRAAGILIAPATANVIGKLASGICDDLLTCTCLASSAPVLIAPAMNENMYLHGIVQQNIASLKKIGYRFVGPVRGRLACNRQGMGHLAAVDSIVEAAARLFGR